MARTRTKANLAAEVAETVATTDPADPWAGLPRRTWADVRELARQQGKPLAADVDRLRGAFWPPEESADDFIAWLKETRAENDAAA